MSRLVDLVEARDDVKMFDELTRVFAYYTDKFPGTFVETVYLKMLQVGIKCLPKDAVALKIIAYVLDRKIPDASKVGEMMNLSFEALPDGIRPVYAEGSQVLTACWKRSHQVYDRVLSLINIEDASVGSWSDCVGIDVSVLNT